MDVDEDVVEEEEEVDAIRTFMFIRACLARSCTSILRFNIIELQYLKCAAPKALTKNDMKYLSRSLKILHDVETML